MLTQSVSGLTVVSPIARQKREKTHPPPQTCQTGTSPHTPHSIILGTGKISHQFQKNLESSIGNCTSCVFRVLVIT